MATVYKVEMLVCSEFCAYPTDELKAILEKLIKDYRDKETGLGLLVYNTSVVRKV